MEKKEWQKKGEGHRQRLREKFLNLDIDAFTDDEVLELLLTFGTPRTDCKEAARAVLKKFGSLAAALEAPAVELKKIKGLGPKNIFALRFINGVARRYLKNRLKEKQYISSSRDVAAYLIHAMRNLKHEVLMALYLDSGHRIIGNEIVAEGTVNVNTVYPREMIKRALKHNAAALVVAHNHPSGSMKPSSQDRSLTRALYLACSFMNIQLLDHLIVGAEAEVFSFADHGIMAEVRQECAEVINPTIG